MTKVWKPLLIGQLYTQKHWEMVCGGRRIIFNNSRKKLVRFFDFFGPQGDLEESLRVIPQ